MHLVEKATFAPAECLITHSPTGPFIDLGLDFDWRHDGRMYICASSVRAMAELLGYIPDNSGEVEALKARIAELEQDNEKLEQFKKQVRKTFEAAGFNPRLKPGRPKKETASNG